MNDKRAVLPVLATVLTVAAGAFAFGAEPAAPKKQPATKARTVKAVARQRHVPRVLVRRLRKVAWRWQIVMGRPRARSAASLHTVRALRYWRRQASAMRRLAANPPHKQGWLCIHRFEGSWADGGDPYWGGLQMDRGFMLTYAPRLLLRRGWADRWSALEQMWVAERAHRSGRGYWPWPSTARACGLL